MHALHHPQLHTHRAPAERGATTRVTIAVLGDFRVTVDGATSPANGWTRRTAAALVKILALAPGHRLHRERVMDLLWPEEAPMDAAPRLHKAAHFARRAAGHPDAVVLRDDIVWLFPDALVTVDAVEFEELARTAVIQNDPVTARAALNWYGGELLPDDRYDDWAVDRRELLHLRRLDVLRVAADWRELAEVEPSDEEAHVELMRLHIDAGDGAAAVAQYEHLERVLDRDLGLTPGDAARRAWAQASELGEVGECWEQSMMVGGLLAELAHLVSRQSAVLAELVAAGVAPAALAS